MLSPRDTGVQNGACISTLSSVKVSKPCHASIHLNALAKYSQISAHVPVFLIACFCINLYWPNLPPVA